MFVTDAVSGIMPASVLRLESSHLMESPRSPEKPILRESDPPFEQVVPAKARLLFAGVGAAAFVLFVGGIYGYARLGGPIVNRLGTRLGEVVVEEAKRLHEAGETAAEIETYRKALDVPFDDPRQRGWALRGLAEALIGDRRAIEALPVLDDCIKAHPDDLKARGLLCDAFRQLERHEDVLTAATAWFEQAALQQSDGDRAHAKYQMGAALEAEGSTDEALEAYLEGHRFDATGLNAYHAAKLLYDAGQPDKALELLDGYIEHGSGWRLDSARKLRDRIAQERADKTR
ncbi:MAG TPA: hypothetical protein PLO37_09605 [Candidatus Hydrogenedentes bacterium]|nr:hypothetical protein [Candidatus Hydrogenedentota bacterium]HPG67087.1 hypothetical protein [Candidatus Hydrogenedentota bacterium]